jgi:hypothetical protein
MDNLHRTRLRIMLLIVVVGLLLLGTMAQAQAPASYSIEAGRVSGGGYRLVTLTWQVCGTVSGGDYHLSAPAAPTTHESGCCCAFLPITLGGD